MARSFASASTQFIQIASAVVSEWPFTVVARIYFTGSVAGNPVAWSVFDYPTTKIAEIYVTSGSKAGLFVENSPASVSVVSTTSLSADTWQHLAGSFNSGDFKVYINGVSENPSSASLTVPSTLDATDIGRNVYGGVAYGHWNGRVAEVAVWSVVLNAQEVAATSQGFAPSLIRPGSRVAYWPLGGARGNLDIDDWPNKYDMSPTNSPTWSDHPKTIYPCECQCC